MAESVKPTVRPEQILALLNEHFDQPVQNLSPVGGGQIAQVLSFRVEERAYILRFNPQNIKIGFEKEAFILQKLATPDIPVPPILFMGQFGELDYVISQKMPGRGLESLTQAEYEQALPSVIHTLYRIHQVSVKEQQNYGPFDNQGRGLWPRWKDFITAIREEEAEENFYGKWHSLFETSFLERDLFQTVYNHMLNLLVYCPEERSLVHGGYGYNNVLVEDGQVTAVLDWGDAKYGDFVYDIAYVDFWPRGFDFSAQARQYYQSQGTPLPNYEERIACYQCYLGLDAMRFFAKTKNEPSYQYTRERIEKLLRA